MPGLRLLVVDDDSMMLYMLPPLLRDELAPSLRVDSVESAQTPEAALALVKAAPAGPLAVLSDFNLKASMTGVDLLGQVARERPDSIRILFSGYSRDQIGEPARDPALHGFVEKPLRIRDMLDPLRQLIDATLDEAAAGRA